MAWLPRARGKAVKIVSFLLTWLPEQHNYQVIFMQRDLDEVLSSQQQMLARRGAGSGSEDPPASREVFASHLSQVERFMAARACFSDALRAVSRGRGRSGGNRGRRGPFPRPADGHRGHGQGRRRLALPQPRLIRGAGTG